MKAGSLFEEILAQKLAQLSGASPTDQSQSTTFNSSQAAPQEHENFKFGIQFEFKAPSQWRSNAYKKAATNSATQEVKAEAQKTDQSQARTVRNQRAAFFSEPILARPKPTVRKKRKLSFDQEKALSVFTAFGEKIDGYSTPDEIKQAYRRLAKKYHPDSTFNGSDNVFKKIAATYSLLKY